MSKFKKFLFLVIAALILTGYLMETHPEKFDKRTLSVYGNIKREASEIYDSGVSVFNNLLSFLGLPKADVTASPQLFNSEGDLTKTLLDKVSEKIQRASGMPEYKYTVNNYEEYYKVIYTALYNFEDSVTIRLNNNKGSLYDPDAVKKVINDNYDMDYGLKSFEATMYTSSMYDAVTIKFKYAFSRDKMLSMRAASEAKAKKIISEIIKPGMSDIQKELAIHDYIVNNTAYDYNNYTKGTLPEESFTIYGVLIKGKAVCEGYAKAMFRLLKMAGIDNMVVTGTSDGVSHAWNLVKIKGSFTHLDTTWDDPVTKTGKGVLSHKYFNLSDEQMAKDHKWDKSKYPRAVSVPLK